MLKEKFTEDLIYSQVFSFEVLNYFDSICTDENYKWIIKYFNILMKNDNNDSIKFNKHHIVPCVLFKNEYHKNRNKTKYLANKINGNIIKLSYKNHIICHYFLWKIFPNNENFRKAIYMMLGKINFKNFTENEIKKFAKIQEEYKKTNKTKEELLIHKKQYRNKNKDVLLCKAKIRYYKNRDKILKKHKERDSQLCVDPIKKDKCSYGALRVRIRTHKELYKDIKPTSCVIKSQI